MRLASKIFLTSALVIVVLAGVGALSLRAVASLVSVNREIAIRAVPALRLTSSAREAMAPLLRLEARAVVLGDPRYAIAWTDMAAKLAVDLERLAGYAQGRWEALHLSEASTAFAGYRQVVAEEHALLKRGDRAGALRGPLAVRSRDEIGALARSFNSMADQLRRLEETRQEFFAAVAHELCSPLTSIRGAADLLHDNIAGPLTAKQRRLTDIIAQSSARLLGLVNQILEMSRLQAGLVEVQRQPVDLAELVDRAFEELHPRAAEAGGTLGGGRIGIDFMYPGDEERLHQLVVNQGPHPTRV